MVLSSAAPPTAEAAAGGNISIDSLVDSTPVSRDRVVDLMRALSIAVVVVWHCTLSITHWRGGALTMPNPVDAVPFGWAATWVLQVMPLFFLVGGYANLAAWEAFERRGRGGVDFLRTRFARLARPVAVWALCWLVADLAWQAAGGRSVLVWGQIVLVPLWFLGVYAGVVLAVPFTRRLHAHAPWVTLGCLAVASLGADALRFGLGLTGAAATAVGLAGSACAWLCCHQLGYWWRDGSLLGRGRVAALRLAGGGLAGLVLLTTFGPYERSMVAVRGAQASNLYPTTACVIALAAFQLGLVLLARPTLQRWLARRGPWRVVVAANAMAMTVFCWHMTALVVFIGLYERAGFVLRDEPTIAWWLARPLWLIGPGAVLALFVSVVGKVELPRAGGR